MREQDGSRPVGCAGESATIPEDQNARLPRWVLYVIEKWNSIESREAKLGFSHDVKGER